MNYLALLLRMKGRKVYSQTCMLPSKAYQILKFFIPIFYTSLASIPKSIWYVTEMAKTEIDP